MRKSVKRSSKRSSKRSMKRQRRTKGPKKKISKRQTKRIKRTKRPKRSKGSKRVKRSNRSRIKARKYRQRGGIFTSYSASLKEGLSKAGTSGIHNIGNVVYGQLIGFTPEDKYVVIDWETGWKNYTYVLALVNDEGEINTTSTPKKLLHFASKAGGSILEEKTKDTLTEACRRYESGTPNQKEGYGGTYTLSQIIANVQAEAIGDEERRLGDEKQDKIRRNREAVEAAQREEQKRIATTEAAKRAEEDRVAAEALAEWDAAKAAKAEEKRKEAEKERMGTEKAMKELRERVQETGRLQNELEKKQQHASAEKTGKEGWTKPGERIYGKGTVVATPEKTKQYLEDLVKIKSLEKGVNKTTWTTDEIKEGLKGLWTQEIFKAFQSNTEHVSVMKDLFARRVEYTWDVRELVGALANYMTQNQLRYAKGFFNVKGFPVTLEDTNPFGENNSVDKADERAAADVQSAAEAYGASVMEQQGQGFTYG